MGVIYYKLKSAKEYDSVTVEGLFVSVARLKELILNSKKFGRGRDFDLIISDAQTNQDYKDDEQLLPRNSSVLVRRVPGVPRVPIVFSETQNPKTTKKEAVDVPLPKCTQSIENSSSLKSSQSTITSDSVPQLEESEWEQCTDILFAEAKSLVGQDLTYNKSAEEDWLIAELVNTPALYLPGKVSSHSGGNLRNGASQGFGLVSKKPPEGYICRRCSVPGHFIQHCPTNGDPKYDFKRLKRASGIPSSMLTQNPDGSYALSNGRVVDVKPNEAVFEREMEAVPSSRPLRDIPPELNCPLCNDIMKSAVISSKCCFKSFCDKCIREYMISKSKCACGISNVLADDLLPNLTLRETITRLLESTTSSAGYSGSLTNIQDMGSAHCPESKVSSTILSMEDQEACCNKKNVVNAKAPADDTNVIFDHPGQDFQLSKGLNVGSFPEVETSEMHETTSKRNDQLPEKEVMLMNAAALVGKQKKKRLYQSDNDMRTQWGVSDDLAAANLAYRSYSGGEYNGYTTTYAGAFPYMNYYPGMYNGPPPFPCGGMNYVMSGSPQSNMPGDMVPSNSRGRQKRRVRENDSVISNETSLEALRQEPELPSPKDRTEFGWINFHVNYVENSLPPPTLVNSDYVFISGEFDKLPPTFLSFLQGPVDYDTLLLNVSRDMFEQHSSLTMIQQTLVRKALALIRKIAAEGPDEYDDGNAQSKLSAAALLITLQFLLTMGYARCICTYTTGTFPTHHMVVASMDWPAVYQLSTQWVNQSHVLDLLACKLDQMGAADSFQFFTYDQHTSGKMRFHFVRGCSILAIHDEKGALV